MTAFCIVYAACGRHRLLLTRHFNLLSLAIFVFSCPATACADDLPPASALPMQKELVKTIATQVIGVREEEKVGQRSVDEVWLVEEQYAQALEMLHVMEARPGKKANLRSRILQARIKVVSAYLKVLRKLHISVQSRFETGEITKTDVAKEHAAVLKVEIRLATLKKTAGK